jgi:hypothetical protein
MSAQQAALHATRAYHRRLGLLAASCVAAWMGAIAVAGLLDNESHGDHLCAAGFRLSPGP